ncbi:MAG TPA: Hsp33 family molecular chaperone HslO [Steroidobacteraceae bacterium]|nr:Hsp33 family molecular chaperone HslO [Steroidobacteraceae bacterium]
MAEAILPGTGQLRRFMLERHAVRGFWVRLDEAWRELRRHQQYAPGVEALLGEALSATVLLAATLKFQGTLTLQLTGDGLVTLLVAQCTHELQVRAVAHAAATLPEEPSFAQLIGHGRLSVTIENDEQAARYQGIVSLEGANLAACLENYFATSEQLPTSVALSADADRAAGVLLQKLPPPNAGGEAHGAVAQEVWEQLQLRVGALDAPLLRAGTMEQVVQRVCIEHDARLFAAAPVRFACRCSADRVAMLLRALGPAELRGIIAEQGTVTVTCEFCGRPYRLDAIDVEQLFSGAASPQAPRSLN